MASLVNSTQHLKNYAIPLKLFKGIEKEGAYPDWLYKVRVALVPTMPGGGTARKEVCRPTPLMRIGAELSTKCKKNKLSSILKAHTPWPNRICSWRQVSIQGDATHDRMKAKNHTIISTAAEKALNKINTIS